MDDGQTEQMPRLLRTASHRQKSASGETAAFNLLSARHIEHYETQTHSQIIFFLLDSNDCSDGQNAFLNLFLQILKIPQAFLGEQKDIHNRMTKQREDQ